HTRQVSCRSSKSRTIARRPEINDYRLRPDGSLRRVSVERVSAHNDDFRLRDRTFQVGGETSADVRNLLLNELPIGSCEVAHGNVFVPNLNFAALAQESLDQLHRGAFAKVIRTRLEAQTENCNLFAFRRQDRFDRAVEVRLVARQDSS